MINDCKIVNSIELYSVIKLNVKNFPREFLGPRNIKNSRTCYQFDAFLLNKLSSNNYFMGLYIVVEIITMISCPFSHFRIFETNIRIPLRSYSLVRFQFYSTHWASWQKESCLHNFHDGFFEPISVSLHFERYKLWPLYCMKHVYKCENHCNKSFLKFKKLRIWYGWRAEIIRD